MRSLTPSFTFLFISTLVIISYLFSVTGADDPHIHCSKECVALGCNGIGIKYGKYCGLGHTGCPGEKPCDDLDACCEIHDECVGKHASGMVDIGCHESFKTCIKKVRKSKKVGFSKECPYEVAIPVMMQGMDLAIMMSQMLDRRQEL